MKRFRFPQWYYNLSLAKKLYFAMSVIGIFITVGLIALIVSLDSLSAIRSYVNGHSLWVRAQKDGVYNLSRYALLKQESDYLAFQKNMIVPLGDKKARIELEKKNPDYTIVQQGFIEGMNHPDDLNGMTEIFRRFRNSRYIDKAITVWANADNEITNLIRLGDDIHKEINSVSPSKNKISALLSQIAPLGKKLTDYEEEFSTTMGQGGRWMENFILKLLLFLLFFVALIGLVFSITLNNRISKSIQEMILVAKEVATGNFSVRAKVSSHDELGEMSDSINKMTANLEQQFTQINNVQKKLRAKTKQLDYAQQSAHIGSWEWDVNVNYIEWSDELFRILGYEPGEFNPTFKEYLNHIHSDDRTILNDLVIDAFNAGVTSNIELYHRVIRKDGIERILSGKVKLYAEDNAIIKMAGTVQDVTEIKQAEDLLKLKTGQLSEAQQLAHLGSWEWNVETNLISWSDELYKLFNFKPQGFSATYEDYLKFVHREDKDYVDGIVRKALDDKLPFEFYHRTFTVHGEIKIMFCKGQVFTDDAGNVKRMTGTAQDLTNLKKAEEALTYKTQQLDRAQQSVNLGSWEWDVSSKKTEWSDELYRIYGLQPQQMQMTLHNFLNFVYPDDRKKVMKILKDVYADKMSKDFYYRIIRADGKERILYASVDMTTNINGHTVCLSGTSQDVTEAKKSEEALLYKTQQLAEAQESAQIGSWEWDVVNDKIEGSDELYRIHGLVPGEQEITYDFTISFIHPDDREYINDVARQQYVDQHQTDVFYRIIKPDGTVRIINGKGKVFTDSSGKTIRMRGTMQDVTELKKAEEALIYKTTQLDKAQRSAHIGSWEWDAESNITSWSDQMYRVYGMASNQSDNSYETVMSLVHPDDREYVDRTIKLQAEDKQRNNIYYRIIRPDASEHILNARTQVFTDETGKIIRMSGTVQNVTRQKLIESKLLEFKYFFNTTSDLACISNADGMFEVVNQSFVDKLGYSNKELTGTQFLDFIHPDDVQPTLDVMGGLAEGNPYVNFVNRYRTKEGEYLWFDWNATPNSETGKIYGMARDITLQKENEQELIRLKDLAENSEKIKDQFLANMSHEIRTPMNAIMGFSDLLAKSDLKEPENDYVKTIKHAGENLLTIINDILDISKIEAGMMIIEKTDFSIRESFKSLHELLSVKADEKNLDLIFECDPKVPDIVIGDPTRFSQIIINLVGNAIKFTLKGKITVTAEVHEDESKNVETDEIAVRFCVKDTGIGIPADKLENIFERFHQAEHTTSRNYGGTGLGLSIARQLVELQGGKITVESKHKTRGVHGETGSVFCFTIPYKKTVSTGNKKVDKKKYNIADLQHINMLIVEDNPLNVKLLQHLFKELNLKSEVAENGSICIRMIKKTAYDVILMDMEMPVLNGYEATNIIRNEMKNDIPIIAMTAHAMAGEKEKCLSLGMNNYISKPLNADLLLEMIYDITFNI